MQNMHLPLIEIYKGSFSITIICDYEFTKIEEESYLRVVFFDKCRNSLYKWVLL